MKVTHNTYVVGLLVLVSINTWGQAVTSCDGAQAGAQMIGSTAACQTSIESQAYPSLPGLSDTIFMSFDNKGNGQPICQPLNGKNVPTCVYTLHVGGATATIYTDNNMKAARPIPYIPISSVGIKDAYGNIHYCGYITSPDNNSLNVYNIGSCGWHTSTVAKGPYGYPLFDFRHSK